MSTVKGPGFVTAALETTDIGWRQTVRSKMLIGVALAILFAAGIAFIIHAYAKGSSAAEDYQMLQLVLLSTVVVPLISLLLGTGAMASEREAGTLTFLFSRPFPRSAVVIGKGLGAILAANVSVVIAVLAVYAASGAPSTGQPLGGLIALMLETTALTSIFVLFGTVLARSLYLGLAYVVLFEGLLGNTVAAKSGYTVSYHARSLLTEWSSRAVRETEVLTTLPPPAIQSVFALLATAVVALVLAGVWVETREYGLKDRPKED